MAIDWRKLKTEYITGQLSYQALAKKHGIALSTVSQAGRKAGWVVARQRYREKVAERTAETLCARTSAREAERLLRLQEAALNTAALLADVLRDPDQFKRHLVVRSTTGVGSQTEERVFEKLDMRAIRAYTASMQSMVATLRNLFELPTLQDKQAMDIQRERLQLEREKRAAAEESPGGTGIVQIAAVLPEGARCGAVAGDERVGRVEDQDGFDDEEGFAQADGLSEDTGEPGGAEDCPSDEGLTQDDETDDGEEAFD